MKPRARKASAGWFIRGLGVLLIFGAAPAPGQQRDEPTEPPDRETDQQIPDQRGDRYIDYDSEPPYDFYERQERRAARDYGRWRTRVGRPYRGGGWWYHGRGWRWDRYGGPGYSDCYGWYGPPYHSFHEGYWEGQRDGRRFAEWERSYEIGRRGYADAMSEGLLAFRRAEYTLAARHFIRAAKVNQGDPASRIHAAHTLVALGKYLEALPALRRAFQLQPKIAYLSLDIRRDYGPKADFDAHLNALGRAAKQAEDDPRLWLLLGYYQYYSGREAQAVRSLAKADALAPGDFMTDALLDAARRVSPPERPPLKSKAAERSGD
jgi:tetratricopeptide (TPR) repeat protein